MERMLRWIEFDLCYPLSKTIIILDNLRIHKSKETKPWLINSRALYIFDKLSPWNGTDWANT